MAPALAAGNCCILKPSELCSLTCLEMAAIAHDVGLPPGVFSVITGTGLDAGAPLRYIEQSLLPCRMSIVSVFLPTTLDVIVYTFLRKLCRAPSHLGLR